MLESETESSGTSHQTLLEGPSVQPQSTEGQRVEGCAATDLLLPLLPIPTSLTSPLSRAGPSQSILVAATSSDSDTEDEALQSSNSHYDNQTPPCTGSTPACLTMFLVSSVDFSCICINTRIAQNLISE